VIQEQFEERAGDAMAIYRELASRYGVYHNDVSPNNVTFQAG